jgi:hypothetical protein
LGSFALRLVHVEDNNLNGWQFQNGAALSLVVRNQPSDAAIRQASKFQCAVARPKGPRQSCGDITEGIAMARSSRGGRASISLVSFARS